MALKSRRCEEALVLNTPRQRFRLLMAGHNRWQDYRSRCLKVLQVIGLDDKDIAKEKLEWDNEQTTLWVTADVGGAAMLALPLKPGDWAYLPIYPSMN